MFSANQMNRATSRKATTNGIRSVNRKTRNDIQQRPKTTSTAAVSTHRASQM